MLSLIEWIVWGIALLLGLYFAIGVRQTAVRRASPPTWPTLILALSLVALPAMFLFLPFSKLHILWLLAIIWPLSLVAGLRYIPFVSQLLILPANIYARILMIGTGARLSSPSKQSPWAARRSSRQQREMPAWAQAIDEQVRPSKPHMKTLESVRKQLGVGQDEFFEFIWTHPEMTRRVLRMLYRKRLRIDKRASREDHFATILMSRVADASGTVKAMGFTPFGLDPSAPTEELEPQVREIASRFEDIDHLIDFILEDEEKDRIPSAESVQVAVAEIGRILALDTEEMTWGPGEAPSIPAP